MDRRSLFKGIAGFGAALLLPPTLAENAEAARRIWALGGLPSATGGGTFTLSFHGHTNAPIGYKGTFESIQDAIDALKDTGGIAYIPHVISLPGGVFALDYPEERGIPRLKHAG